MSTVLHLAMNEMAVIIATSVADVLAARDAYIAGPSEEPISTARLADMLREIGNNATMCLLSIDENPANGPIESMESTWRPADGVWP